MTEKTEDVEERWRPVPGKWPYEVSDQGRVRRSEPSIGTHVGYVLTNSVGPNGYEYVRLTDNNGEQKRFRVHRLVLTAFVGDPPDGHEGDHIDGVRTNNNLGNLRWLPRRENRRQNNCKVDADDAENMRLLYASGEMDSVEISKLYPISKRHVVRIIRGKHWPDAGGPIKGVDYE